MPDKIITKHCKTHGDTEYIYENRGYYRCRKCRYEKSIRWKRKVKQKALDKLGGKCSKCGYDRCISALEFHHKDGKDKDFAIGDSWKSWSKVEKEIEKCVLLCANCHREEHDVLFNNT